VKEVEFDRRKAGGLGARVFWSGEDWGLPLDNEDRSEPALWIDCRSSSVKRWKAGNLFQQGSSSHTTGEKSLTYGKTTRRLRDRTTSQPRNPVSTY
jgi:hypothetical protein